MDQYFCASFLRISFIQLLFLVFVQNFLQLNAVFSLISFENKTYISKLEHTDKGIYAVAASAAAFNFFV